MRITTLRVAGRRRTRFCQSRWSLGVCAFLALSFQFAGCIALAADVLDRPVTLDIPANTRLDEALIEWGVQAGVALMINTPTIEHQTTDGVRGTLPAGIALAQLLHDTGLSYTAEGGRVRVIPVSTLVRSAQRDAQPESSLAKSTSDTQAKPPSESDAQENAETGIGHSQNDARQNDLEVVVVTAQRREERLIDVPMSIVAIDPRELQQRGIMSVDDLASAVPGVSIESNGYQRRIEIRGISNSNSNGNGNSSLIGMYLDEADVTSYATTQLDLGTYDLERIEVLRGPQGTLYGGGSAGGTIRFITKSPNLTGFAFSSDVAELFPQYGAPGQHINAMLNVPVIDQELGFRLVARFENGGGWIDQPVADRKNINGQELADVRMKGLWQPSAQATVSVMAEVHRNRTAPGLGEDANGNFTQVFDLTTTPSVVDNFDIYNVTLTYDFEAFRVLSTTSFVRQDTTTTDLGYIIPLGAGTPPFQLYDSTPFGEHSSSLTDELRLTSIGSSPWQWTVGAYYRRFLFDYDLGYLLGQDSLANAFFTADRTESTSKSWATFGDTSYKIADRFTLGAGIRYYRDEEEFTGIDPAVSTQTETFHAVSPRGYGLYKLTADANVYASAAKGFRSGGFNSLNQPSYNPENVWTYELGMKLSLADSRLNTNVAIFYSDYNDYQVVGFTAAAPVNIIYNAGAATIKGVEFDSTWRPGGQWTLAFNGDYLDTKFTKISAANTGIDVGDRIGLVPLYALNISAQRDFKWNGKSGYIRLEYDKIGRENNDGTAGGVSDVLNLVNFNSSLYMNKNLRLGLFGRNLLNDRGHTDPLEIYNYAARERPRTFGIEFGVDFH